VRSLLKKGSDIKAKLWKDEMTYGAVREQGGGGAAAAQAQGRH
jgi:hypothetical protein